MDCPKCGAQNPDVNWTCGNCGEVLPPSGESAEAGGQESTGYQPYVKQASPPPVRQGIKLTTWIVILVVIALAALAGWYFLLRKTDTGTPHGAMEAYLNAISDKDCGAAYDLTSGTQGNMPRDQAVSACNQFIDIINFSISDFNLIDEKIDGDTATVTFEVKISMGGQSVNQQMTAGMVRENGQWKVDTNQLLDPSALQNQNQPSI